MSEVGGGAPAGARGSGSLRGPLAIVLAAVLLAALAWALVVSRREAPLRQVMAVHDNLVDAFRDGELVATTRWINLGQERGARQTVAPELRLFEEALGFVARPGGEPPFAWAAGQAPWIDLDVLQPRDRVLSLRVAKGVRARDQFVTPVFEGHALERQRLRRDGGPIAIEHAIPAAWQRRGRNRLELRFDSVDVRRLEDLPAELSLSGIVTSLRFLAEGDDGAERPTPRAGVLVVPGPGGERRRVVLPAAASARAATELPEGERVILRASLDRLDVPVELSLLTDAGLRTQLARLGPDAPTPSELKLDLARWAGQTVLIEAWARGEPGQGEVHLSQVHVLLPEEQRKAWLAGRGGLGAWRGVGQRRATEGDEAVLEVREPPRAQVLPYAGSSPGTGLPQGPERPSVLLVVLDTLARRAVGAFGAEADATPRLDALAAGGLVVPDMLAPASYTLASVGSLLTGLEPPRHGVELVAGPEGLLRLADDAPRLAGQLSARGWRTAAFVTNPNAAGRHGYDAGFERFDELFADPALWDEGVAGEHLPPRLAGWLDELGDEPFFGWVHVFEPHAPYAAPDELRARFVQPYAGEVSGAREYLDAVKHGAARPDDAGWRHLRQLYTARVAQADRVLGALLDTLAASGRADDTLVVVTSDHGESLGEHGAIEHGDLVFGHQVDVPLVFAAPWLPRGRLQGPASLVDVAPTILAQAGLPRPEAMRGLDLLRELPDPQRARLTRSAALWPVYGWQRGDWKLVVDTATRAVALYDLARDPGEQHDLARARVATRALLLRELVAALGEVEQDAQAGAEVVSGDAGMAEQIEQLGYAQGGVGAAEAVADTPLLRLRGMCRRL